jgi:hypothetical protein
MVDGFDELPAEYQEKVKYALEHGNVPDEDWKGVSLLYTCTISRLNCLGVFNTIIAQC